MTQHAHFPRAPSPYPPPVARTRTPSPSSPSTKRPSSESSRSNSDTAVEEGLVDDYESNSRPSKMSSPPTRPAGPDRRSSLASLSVAADQNAEYAQDDPLWPKGWRPYTCLTGGFFLMFNSWGLVNAYGTYASYYMQHLMPERQIYLFNLVGATQSFVVLILSAIVGRFLDAGHQRILIITGTVLVSLGSFMLSICNGSGGYDEGRYWLTWLTQGFVSGLGMACFFVTSSQVVATWFRKRKGFAIGIVASGASIAGLVYPMMFKFLILDLNFPNTARCVAAVTTATSALAIFIARPNPEFEVRAPETWSMSVFVNWSAFKNAGYSWFCAAICWMFFGFYAVFFNLEEWAASKGLGYKEVIPNNAGVTPEFGYTTPSNNAVRTFYLLSIMNATSTIGRLASAYLCDHFGALNVHVVVTFIASVLVLVGWTLSNTVPAAIAFVVLFGIFSGAVIGLPPASVAYVLGPDQEAQANLGQWTGMMYSLSAAPALAGPVIAGYLISEYETYLTVQMWSGGCLLISAFCMGMAIFYRAKAMPQETTVLIRVRDRLNSIFEDTATWGQPSTRASSVTEKTAEEV